ncbi:MAG: universal stress protein [Cyanobacteria bacterium P01_C01_bin.69]
MGSVVCHLTDNWGADLIVIHQPVRSKLDELLLGSVSHYILHHAPCAVMTVVKPK